MSVQAMASGLLRGYFITGTDTEVGKTEITLGLMTAIAGSGWTVAGMKPVASGCDVAPSGLRNPDALRIAAACSREVEYALVNPYAFEPAVAPHLAAAQAGVEIRFDQILDSYRVLSAEADVTVVEGVGGWRVPLGPDGDLADLAVALGLPVVLVVGLRLGCINHALLTVESILGRGLALAGWVANSVDPAMALREENIATLRGAIDAPCLGVVPWMENPDPAAVAACLDPGPRA